MAVVINTNVDSIKIQNILTNSTNKMAQSMQRMSTGLKINSAKDDAAGSVISARMDVQLSGNKIAQNNVQNGNAMLSTAEGNIDIVLDNVSRIRDLTLQAKNGTYSEEEIQAMQDEVAERVAEIDRISNSSKYSQLNLFGDSELENGVTFQVGANSTADDVITAVGSIFKSIEFGEITGMTALTPEVTKGEDGKVDKDVHKVVGTADDKYSEADAETEGAFYAALEDGTGKWYVADEDGDVAGNTIYKVADKPTYLDLTALDGTAAFNTALDQLDAAIDDLTARKSQIGSAQNRLDSAYSALTTQFENLSSAKSIITDADIASEASSFTQQQILQQVSTSLLAQANQAPSIALSLV